MNTIAQSLRSTIVIVEDERDILDITAEVLRDEGFKTESFCDPRQALEYLRDHQPALVLTDLRLPGFSGRDFIAQVRAKAGASLPVAVMSAAVDLSEQIEAGNLDVQAYLKKPFELDDLCALASRFAVPAPGNP